MTISSAHRRCASVYVMVFSSALLVTLIGVSAVLAVRVRHRSIQGDKSFIAARGYAQSAVDLGLYTIANDPDWRTNYPNGAWFSDRSLGNGSITLTGVDPDDGDLSDSEGDSLVLVGTGNSGEACYHLQVTLVPPIQPLAALGTCLHAGDDVFVWFDGALSATDAPLSANDQFKNFGSVNGDVEADSVFAWNPINGTVTEGAAPKDLPDAGVFSEYVALATPIAFTGNISGTVLGPGLNPWGATNPDGVYYIDTAGSDLRIEGTRLEGTLLVDTGGGVLYIGEQVLFNPAREDYPVLIVDGDLSVEFDNSSPLEESDWETNFNPPQLPYEGQSDSDQSDEYPNELHGLVHVTGNLACQEHSIIQGVVICEGNAVCDDHLELTHDPDLVDAPPLHYTSYGVPAISPGSWQQTLPSN
ncbi:MAG: hypothetical protein KAY37_16460 [Phycisphaerae bacterium]|nr:hypothetical protein [Phycisphaerae bacterium]